MHTLFEGVNTFLDVSDIHMKENFVLIMIWQRTDNYKKLLGLAVIQSFRICEQTSVIGNTVKGYRTD
jgi:hypothetical protein